MVVEEGQAIISSGLDGTIAIKSLLRFSEPPVVVRIEGANEVTCFARVLDTEPDMLHLVVGTGNGSIVYCPD